MANLLKITAFVVLTLVGSHVFANSDETSTIKKDELKSMLDGAPLPESGKGYKLFNVQSGSLFEKLGLKPGDKIVSINGKDLNSISGVQKAYAQIGSGEEVEVVYFRNGKQHRETASTAK